MKSIRAETDGVTLPGTSRRLRLWIDSVGGYLVCLSNQVILGSPAANADVPIHGNLSRQHARIRRNGEMYLIDPLREVKLAGRKIERSQALAAQQEIELGDGAHLRFIRPHPLSNTARLDFLADPRCSLAVDAVVLMAETCILGPDPQSHVLCSHWQDSVVLFQQPDGQLGCRCEQSLVVDGQPCDGRAILRPNSRVEGPDFAFSFESC